MSDVLTPFDDAATTAAVIASTKRWLERAVIGLNLCPFAKAVYVKRQIRYAVTAVTTAEELLAELRHELELLRQANPEEVDTTLLIHPQAMTDFIDFHFFLKEGDAAIRNLGQEGSLQIASFHPAYEFAGSAPDDIANCTNRSPHPTLHLLRETSIDRAVAAFPDAAAIYERNIDTLRRLGHEGWRLLPEARLRGIARELVACAERWASSVGVREFASDARVGNEASHAICPRPRITSDKPRSKSRASRITSVSVTCANSSARFKNLLGSNRRSFSEGPWFSDLPLSGS